MNRKLVIRSAVFLAFVLIALFLFYIGRGATLLLDNRTAEAGGRTFEAFPTVRISVDGKAPVELYPRDRDKVEIMGFSHRITVTVLDRSGKETEKKSGTFRLSGKSRMYLASIPAFTGGADGWLTEFTAADQQAPEPQTPEAGPEAVDPAGVPPTGVAE